MGSPLLILGFVLLGTAGALFYWMKDREGPQYFFPSLLMMMLCIAGVFSIGASNIF